LAGVVGGVLGPGHAGNVLAAVSLVRPAIGLFEPGALPMEVAMAMLMKVLVLVEGEELTVRPLLANGLTLFQVVEVWNVFDHVVLPIAQITREKIVTT